jgi:subtilisin family serine protease
MDTGIDKSHPEYKPIPDWAGVSTRAAGSWNVDGYGHGTHVTGTLAARRNGFGVVGVAPGARVVVVKVFDANGEYVYASSVAGAALQCRRLGAKVINMSLGGAGFSQQESDVFAWLLKSGTVSVAGTSLVAAVPRRAANKQRRKLAHSQLLSYCCSCGKQRDNGLQLPGVV